MSSKFTDWIIEKLGQWLMKNKPPTRNYWSDFDKVYKKIQPGDVLLVEGRNRVSHIIQRVSLSRWSHAALYIGKINDIADPKDREIVRRHSNAPEDNKLLIEGLLGSGNVVSPLSKYQDDHVRILRPQRLSQENVQKVIKYAIGRLGKKYSLRHLFDLARLLFPWGLFPRRWRSSLFQHKALQPTEDICSSLIADAFESIHYPILPVIEVDREKHVELIQRNPRLFTPSDFDYSPYFDVIKYPIFKLDKNKSLIKLPWKEGEMSDI